MIVWCVCVCVCVCVCTCVHVHLLSCVQLFCNFTDTSPPSSSVHGSFQARILEWVARGSFQPREWTHVSCVACIGGGFFTTEPPEISLTEEIEMSSFQYNQGKRQRNKSIAFKMICAILDKFILQYFWVTLKTFLLCRQTILIIHWYVNKGLLMQCENILLFVIVSRLF